MREQDGDWTDDGHCDLPQVQQRGRKQNGMGLATGRILDVAGATMRDTETQVCKPGGSCDWFVSGKEGDTVTIVLTRQQNSGGHQHPGGPIGSALPSEFVLTGPYPQNRKWTYRAPIACGIIKVVSRFSSGGTDTDYVHIKVDGLEALSGSESLVLVGATAKHPDNHYGTPALNAKLRKLAEKFYAKFNVPIAVNDMSLVWGGLFDVEGNWGSPHLTHRDGRHADVRSRTMSDDQKAFFRSEAGILFSSVVLEFQDQPNEHWHLTL